MLHVGKYACTVCVHVCKCICKYVCMYVRKCGCVQKQCKKTWAEDTSRETERIKTHDCAQVYTIHHYMAVIYTPYLLHIVNKHPLLLKQGRYSTSWTESWGSGKRWQDGHKLDTLYIHVTTISVRVKDVSIEKDFVITDEDLRGQNVLLALKLLPRMCIKLNITLVLRISSHEPLGYHWHRQRTWDFGYSEETAIMDDSEWEKDRERERERKMKTIPKCYSEM